MVIYLKAESTGIPDSLELEVLQGVWFDQARRWNFDRQTLVVCVTDLGDYK